MRTSYPTNYYYPMMFSSSWIPIQLIVLLHIFKFKKHSCSSTCQREFFPIFFYCTWKVNFHGFVKSQNCAENRFLVVNISILVKPRLKMRAHSKTVYLTRPRNSWGRGLANVFHLCDISICLYRIELKRLRVFEINPTATHINVARITTLSSMYEFNMLFQCSFFLERPKLNECVTMQWQAHNMNKCSVVWMPEMRWKVCWRRKDEWNENICSELSNSSRTIHLFECEFRIHIQYSMCATSISIHFIIATFVCAEKSWCSGGPIWFMNKVYTLDYLFTENFWSGWWTGSGLQTYRISKVHDLRTYTA